MMQMIMWKRILSLSTIVLAGCISILKIAKNYETNQQFTSTSSATINSKSYAAPDPNVHYCKAYKWKETTGNETLDAEYDFFANVINEFADNGIQILLNQGSLLGAARHFNFISWDVQDVDFEEVKEE